MSSKVSQAADLPPYVFALVLLLGALSFATALAWNEAAKENLKKYLPSINGDSATISFVYAVTVTVILIAFAILVKNWFPSVAENV